MASSSGNDDDLTIPRAAINKMIKETLPSVRVANDARELVVNCCTEFIHLISSEANEICNKSEKKTISPEHVIQALESLGFGSYISEVKEVLQECKTVALKRRKASPLLENLGIKKIIETATGIICKSPLGSKMEANSVTHFGATLDGRWHFSKMTLTAPHVHVLVVCCALAL
uniref:Protein Dr1 n=1 Tax=Camelus bactrianus TaxID=9837 RepID=A0A9W3HFH4_CAMBA|nr:protein Dr1 isoform X1 [Camelus bactrianus]